LVLVGGGHSNVQVLEALARKAPDDVQITLVSDAPTAYYSGMFPGCLAGVYQAEDIQIELDALCRWAGARFFRGRVTGIDSESKTIHIQDRPPIRFDLCSVNVGSRTREVSLPGVREFAVATRPISQLLAQVEAFERDLSRDKLEPRVIVVGGGAAGVELAFSLSARLRKNWPQVSVTLVDSHASPLEDRGPWVASKVRMALEKRNIQIATRSRAVRVEKGKLHLEAGGVLGFDLLVWATGAGAHDFLQDTSLETDEAGFLRVNRHLQSLSSPRIFAAGDCISLENHPTLPKAGVYAVREGPVLAENLLRALEGRSPRPYSPQGGFLALVATGDGEALASWRGAAVQGRWVWRLKDWIDRRFMERFDVRLMGPPPGAMRPKPAHIAASLTLPQCRGCGAKVGATPLYEVLRNVHQGEHPRVLVGLLGGEDAAVLEVPPDRLQVQTLDAFPAFLDDGYLMGRIATLHAASDLFAMGAAPETAMLLLTIPRSHPRRAGSEIQTYMTGVVEELERMGAALVGGHTLEGADALVGLSMTGLLAAEDRSWFDKGALEPGDELVLTKGLGVGVVLAAQMRLQAKGTWVEAAIASMLLSNQGAVELLRRYHVKTVTDVTGFGLAGHLGEMLRTSQVGARLELEQIPVLPGVREALELGVLSSLDAENRGAVRDLGLGVGGGVREALLYDPQTSGGLLCGVKAGRGQALVVALHKAGYPEAARIGVIIEGGPRITAL
jgi:selenide,water dikinase